MHTTLIATAQLQALMDAGTPLRVFDCSSDLMNPAAGADQFLQAHLPGARHADLGRDLSAHAGGERASGGRHPLPTREAFAHWLAHAGVDHDMQVVVYDRQGANYCGRLWWMLKWCGHEAVAVLDGGLQAWQAAGGAVHSGPAHQPDRPGSFVLQTARADTADTRGIASQLGSRGQTLIDARSAPRFRGEIEPLDPVAGHIPGALNRPFADNLGPDGRFKPAPQLRAEFEQLLAGRDPATVVHHCGSGVSAVPNLLAMELAGLGRGQLYPGSWSEWCNTQGMPCAQSQAG
ncbi:MAG: sulfurtransferase [Hydrogenophaga sp.]|jgi:thiosulfate/3-mercaptopyruvate sulfurtransferase|nr:sulfurtransferase [Hydrogenophaga sp.]